ncbi:hypothetical protein GTP56_13825 [Duganella sp. FT134W]|uniref:Uncharacterized protein n=1 Tax=Duganella margarita TaxID=2692170 RepID=A0A7X4H0V9_9BURK|nr:hypothetical protein [Duganella margarita]MYM73271.1 hypothetical protein [Duganella margarita]
MKTLCTAILLAALCATAHADVDIDTARKLAAVKSLALSPERISPEQVAKALDVKLEKTCGEATALRAGRYHVCGYRPSDEDRQSLAFLGYKTVNRGATKDTGGVVMFLAHADRQCLRQDDLVKVFQSAPVASASPVFPEPTLPYIPVRTYQFVFPGHSDSEMYLRVVQTGDCITTVDLIRN